ncbi:hypothetical protein KC340_g11064 [Hortaea werneckii]|nr:hypothetical protein KC342_g11874 [Hortaea werneckii]KAI7086218.1 hypothetical protein KC339_g12902 [Hortaea werneckii]KAI7229734.1 hypothetical protein KC365_g7916 [Hortaea werneckii]KAI7308434.1 hypothetical protein KC340_g11064 [Hortaea werneckii]KAI7377967.1 hypothetical protein KC328_g14144 [Hortaea werneckii]
MLLSTALRRSQAELQAHQRWLSSFVLASRAASRVYSPTIPQRERLPAWQQQSRHYAYHVPKHVRRRQRQERDAELHPQPGSSSSSANELQLEQALAQAITDVNIRDVISIFSQMQDYRALHRSATWRICQCLHEALRRQSRAPATEAKRQDMDEMVAFAEKIVAHIRKGNLAPDCRAHLHLLGFFKESGAFGSGVAFWHWLENQDDEHVNKAVYGVAIDLLAVNGNSLSELEDLYERALERFPGQFNAYYLAPNSILADREAPTTIPGIPMILLQGILSARLLRGDSKSAYLALDTALRLYPTVTPSRFFDVFVEERPLAEAFAVYAMACRAGNPPSYENMRRMLTEMRGNADMRSPDGYVSVLRQMLLTTYLFVGGGGQLTGNLLNELAIALTKTTRLRGFAALEPDDKRRVATALTGLLRQLFDIFARYSVTPGIGAFNSFIVNVAGFGQSRHLIEVALENAASINKEPNHVTRRSVLTAAGLIRDQGLVAASWNELVTSKAEDGQLPDATDFHILVKAAKISGAIDFAKGACIGMDSYLAEDQLHGIYERLDSDDADPPSAMAAALDVRSLLSQLNVLRADMVVFHDRTVGQPRTQDFGQQTPPLTILPPPEELRLPEVELRQLYDEMTTEQQEKANDGQPAHTSSPGLDRTISETNLPLGQLRYESWKMINNLLAWADMHDKAYEKAVDEAIAAGVAPPSREQVLKGRLSNSARSSIASYVSAGTYSPTNPESNMWKVLQLAICVDLSLRDGCSDFGTDGGFVSDDGV